MPLIKLNPSLILTHLAWQDNLPPCFLIKKLDQKGRIAFISLINAKDPPRAGHTSSVRLSRGGNRTTGKDPADLPKARGQAI